jgi:hypothetical protein
MGSVVSISLRPRSTPGKGPLVPIGYEIKKNKAGLASSGITFIPRFVKIGQLVSAAERRAGMCQIFGTCTAASPHFYLRENRCCCCAYLCTLLDDSMPCPQIRMSRPTLKKISIFSLLPSFNGRALCIFRSQWPSSLWCGSWLPKHYYRRLESR